MRLDSETLARLRDELQKRGARASIPPAPGASPPPHESSPEVRALVQRLAPVCEVLYLLMLADHARDAREHEVLRGAVRALTDGVIRSATVDAMLARFDAAEKAQGRAARLAQVTAQLAADREDAEAAFVLAAVMAIADEAPDDAERRLLDELREQLGISRRRAWELLGEAGMPESTAP
jgi:hypothetical protein